MSVSLYVTIYLSLYLKKGKILIRKPKYKINTKTKNLPLLLQFPVSKGRIDEKQNEINLKIKNIKRQRTIFFLLSSEQTTWCTNCAMIGYCKGEETRKDR